MLVPGASEEEGVRRFVTLEAAEGAVVDVELGFVGGGGSAVLEFAVRVQVEGGEFDVDYEVVEGGSEVRGGGCGLLGSDGIREEEGEDVAADEEIWRAVGEVLGVPEDGLVDDRDAAAHGLEGSYGGVVVADLFRAQGEDFVLRVEVAEEGDDGGFEAAALFEDEGSEIGAFVVSGEFVVAGVAAVVSVEVEPVEEWVSEDVVAGGGGTDPTAGFLSG
jgi:hypothetical protein